ncbi:hypothetical protein A3F66_05860 [candidate division TM6 bacterium RIFCSPHIGHO2_12_FULL_32_22]|nr:MAG: hypothetical protein A3F66_05860 [candidate division TM6 bacterium RIFCSPHIGHO2_12_FULL_32_22]
MNKIFLLFILSLNNFLHGSESPEKVFYLMDKVRYTNATDEENISYLEEALKYRQSYFLKFSLGNYIWSSQEYNCFGFRNKKRENELDVFRRKFETLLCEAEKRHDRHFESAKIAILKDDGGAFGNELKYISNYNEYHELANFAVNNLAPNCLQIFDLGRVQTLVRHAILEVEITDDNCTRIKPILSIFGLDENEIKTTNLNNYNLVTLALEANNHRLAIELLKLYPNLLFVADSRGMSPLVMMKYNKCESMITELQGAGVLTDVDVEEHLRRSESQTKRLRVIERERTIQKRHQVLSEILSRPARTISIQASEAEG